MVVYYIGADVHSNDTELAVEHKGVIVQRHAVARKLLLVLWGMWKNHSRFDPSLCESDEA
jgi:hypothetical protein